MVVPLLNIPILSVAFLLLAGILIGHLIWFRDRSDDEATLSGLASENNELQAALHEHKQAYVALEADLEDHRKEWDQLKAANKQLEQAHVSTDHDLTELNNEIARLQQLKDQAFHDLDQERQQRRTLQEALAKAEENTTRVNNLSEQLQSQVSAFQTERAEIDQIAQARISEKESIESELRSQLEELKQANADLQQRELAEPVDNAQVDALTAKRDDAERELVEARQSAQRLHVDLRARDEDLQSLREERDEFTRQLEDERASREKLEQQLSGVQQLVSQRDDALSVVESLEQQTAELQRQLSEAATRNTFDHDLQEENKAIKKRLAAITQEHDAVATMLVDERSRLSKMEADNHRLSIAATETNQKSDLVVEDLKEELNQQKAELDTLRSELEETAAQLSRERHQREHLQTVLHDRKVSAETEERTREDLEKSMQALTTQNATLTEQSRELDALRGEHESVKRMLENATVQVHELRDTQGVTLDQRQQLELRVDEVTNQNADLTQRISHLTDAKNEYVNELDTLQQAHSSSLSARIALEEKLEEQQNQLATLQRQLVDFHEVKEAFRDQQERLNKVVAQRDEVMESTASGTETIQALRDQLETQSRSLSSLNQQNDQLRSMSAEYEDLRRSNLALSTQISESSDRMRRVVTERDDLLAQSRELEDRLHQLETRSRANEETIRNLRRERGHVLSRSRQPVVSSVPFASHSVPEESGGRLRRDEVLGLVYTQPPKRKDDLKRISGIAQVLEKKLNAFGVYTYRQVMEWDSVAVAEFSKLLSFRDRIERDDWIGQARNLFYETYGRAA